MDSELISASSAQGRPTTRGRDTRSNIKWVIGEAIQDCQDLLSLRQQTVTITNLDLFYVKASLQDPLARLLSLAIDEVSSVSCRKGVLSVRAAGHDIVIQSNHPLDIMGQALTLDAAFRAAARELPVQVDLAWEQGLGPRLTVSLLAEG